jgi:hypothetical protein
MVRIKWKPVNVTKLPALRTACYPRTGLPPAPHERNVQGMKNSPDDCKVCLVPHDDEIHEATLSVHEWYRWQVTQGFVPDETDPVEIQVA